jgi:hypothetical protein
MDRSQGGRARLGSLIAVALGALAIFVLPGLASARHSSDDNGGDSSATVKAFDNTTRTLVISLPDGQTVSGTVTRRTKIRCEDQSGHRHGGDRVRGREAEPGDDRGGHGNEPGDDSSGPGSSHSGSSGHDDNGSGANCTTADLVPGAAVEEIDLDFGPTSVRFDEVELNHSS